MPFHFLTAGNVSERSKELVFSDIFWTIFWTIFWAISIFKALFVYWHYLWQSLDNHWTVIGQSLESHWTVNPLFAHYMPAVIEQIYFCSCLVYIIKTNKVKMKKINEYKMRRFVIWSNELISSHFLFFFSNIFSLKKIN